MKIVYQALLDLLVGTLSTALGTGLVAIVVIAVLKAPSFGLHLDFIPQKVLPEGIRLPVLDFSIINKKWLIDFKSGEILFGIFLPADFVQKKKLQLQSDQGLLIWDLNLLGANKVKIHGKDYVLSRQRVSLPVYRDSRTHFLRVIGDFSADQNLRVYYYFETPIGRYPRYLRQGEVIETAEAGNLPYAEINLE